MSGQMKKKVEIQWIILGVAFVGWLIFNGILLCHHELWRDEANVWLIARDMSPIQLFREIKYQGHPCLWYLLMMPFAKVGLPFETICVISFLVMAVTAGIFLVKAPLYMPVKILLIFSPIFTYYYPVVARNYCLSALVLFLLAMFYEKRNDKPVIYGLLLGLLVQTDIIALAPAGMISLMWFCETLWYGKKNKEWSRFKNAWKGLWMPLVSLFVLIGEFLHVSDSPAYTMKIYSGWDLYNQMKRSVERIFWGLTGYEIKFAMFWIFVLVILAVVFTLRIKNGWAIIVAGTSFLVEVAFSTLVYPLHMFHFIYLCFVLIWMLWVLGLQRKEKNLQESRILKVALGSAQVWLLFLAVLMFINWNTEKDGEGYTLQEEWNLSCSDGVGAAEFIEKNIAEDEVIISDNIPRASSVVAFLDKDYDFYYAGTGKRATYANYTEEESTEISLADLTVWVKETFPEKESYYLFITGASCVRDTEDLAECEIVYQTEKETIKGEEYTLYRVPVS